MADRRSAAPLEETLALEKFRIDLALVDSAYIEELESEKISAVWDEENQRWICGGFTGPSWREAVVNWLESRAAQAIAG